MVRRLPALLGLGLAFTLGAVADARAGCARTVYVDGLVQFAGAARGHDLPPVDGHVAAVAPACRDGGQGPDEHDQRVTVSRMRGIPRSVATRDADELYVAAGQLTMLSGHPLHREQPRPAGCSARGPALRLRARTRLGTVGLRGGGRQVVIDSDTRLTNRPVTTPLLDGQRVRASTRRCRRGGLVADRLSFVGHDVTPARRRPNFGHGGRLPWYLLGFFLLLAFGLLFAPRT